MTDAALPIGAQRPSLASRVFGLGSVFGKSLRDSRWSVLATSLLLGGLTFVTGLAIADQFTTAGERAAIAAQMTNMPAMFRGLLGEPIEVETLPGLLSWRVVGFMPVMLGMWSIVALGGTLAGEAARGTLELVLSTPVSRRSLATQKFVAHAVGAAIVVLVVAALTWLSGAVFGTLPGDEVQPTAALAEFAMVGLIALLAGSITFALGTLFGRTIAAGIGGAYLIGSYVVSGYADLVPGFDTLRFASVFAWTAGHRPMAGAYEWPGVALVAALTALFAVLGVVLFERRDLAATVRLPTRRPKPLAIVGRALSPLSVGRWSLTGPASRSLGERLPAAIGWGSLLGLYGLVIAVSADEFSRSITAVPQVAEMISRFFPNVDFTTAGGILQLALFGFVALMAGVAASSLVGGWTSDEREGRLEVVLAAPVRRAAWFVRSGGAVLAAVLAMSLLIGVATGAGAAATGDPALPIVAGALVIGGYAAALAGVGIAVAGLGWPSLGGPMVAVFALAMYLLELIGGILQLPADVLNLSLLRHLGQPMAGSYDWPGMAACAALALGGLVLGAAAFARRDLR